MRLDGRIFKDRRAADQNLAGIGIVDACQVADDRGFACAVGTDQTVDRCLGDRHIQLLQRREAVEALGKIFDFNHAFSSFVGICARSSSRVAPSAIACCDSERIFEKSSCFFCFCRGRASAANEPLPGTLIR